MHPIISSYNINADERFTDLNPRWYESSSIRHTIAKVLVVSGTILAGAAVLTGLYLTATPGIVIGLTLSFAATALAMTITGIALLLIPCWNCPKYRRAQMEGVLKDINRNDLRYRDIQNKYGKLIEQYEILNKDDLNHFLKREVHELSYPQFIDCLGEESVNIFDSQNIEIMGKKLSAHIDSLKLTPVAVEKDWEEHCRKFDVDVTNLKLDGIQRLCSDLQKERISYETFKNECGENNLKYLSDDQKNDVRVKFLSHLSDSELGLLEVPKQFAYEWKEFGLQTEDIVPYVLKNQLELLENQKFDFEDFYQKNGLKFETFDVHPRIPKQAFLRMPYVDMVAENNEEIRKTLGITEKDMLETLSYHELILTLSNQATEAQPDRENAVATVLKERIEKDLIKIRDFRQLLLLFPKEVIEARLLPKDEVKRHLITFLSNHAEDLFDGQAFEGSNLYPYLITEETQKILEQYLKEFELERNRYDQLIKEFASQKDTKFNSLKETRNQQVESLKKSLENLRQEVTEAERKYTDLKIKSQQTQNEFESLKDESISINKKLEGSSNYLKSSELEQEKLDQEFNSKALQMDQIGREVNDAKWKFNLTKEDVNKLISRLEVLNKEMERIEREGQKIAREALQYLYEIDRMRKRFNEINSQIPDKKKELLDQLAALGAVESEYINKNVLFKEEEVQTKSKIIQIYHDNESKARQLNEQYEAATCEENKKFEIRKEGLIKAFKSALSSLN